MGLFSKKAAHYPSADLGRMIGASQRLCAEFYHASTRGRPVDPTFSLESTEPHDFEVCDLHRSATPVGTADFSIHERGVAVYRHKRLELASDSTSIVALVGMAAVHGVHAKGLELRFGDDARLQVSYLPIGAITSAQMGMGTIADVQQRLMELDGSALALIDQLRLIGVSFLNPD